MVPAWNAGMPANPLPEAAVHGLIIAGGAHEVDVPRAFRTSRTTANSPKRSSRNRDEHTARTLRFRYGHFRRRGWHCHQSEVCRHQRSRINPIRMDPVIGEETCMKPGIKGGVTCMVVPTARSYRRVISARIRDIRKVAQPQARSRRRQEGPPWPVPDRRFKSAETEKSATPSYWWLSWSVVPHLVG